MTQEEQWLKDALLEVDNLAPNALEGVPVSKPLHIRRAIKRGWLSGTIQLGLCIAALVLILGASVGLSLYQGASYQGSLPVLKKVVATTPVRTGYLTYIDSAYVVITMYHNERHICKVPFQQYQQIVVGQPYSCRWTDV